MTIFPLCSLTRVLFQLPIGRQGAPPRLRILEVREPLL
jgi:hypothetical protein